MSVRDTHPTVERKQIDLLRQAGSTESRLALGLRMSEEAIRISRRELRRLHPNMTDRQIALVWVKLHYGDDIFERLERFFERGAST